MASPALALALVAAEQCAGAANLHASDTTNAVTDTVETHAEASRFYFGGNVGLIFSGRLTHFVVQPLVGYKLTPKVSIGAKAIYEYLKDRRPDPDTNSHNYGGGVFSRYRFIREGFAHIELAATSYDFSRGRTTIPFLLVGGGYTRPLGPGTWLVVEVLMDLIRDDDSPFQDWEPRVHVGILTGY